MANLKRLEYVWLDGYKPNHLRSKVKMAKITSESLTSVEKVPKWSFDGSSTNSVGTTNENGCSLLIIWLIGASAC